LRRLGRVVEARQRLDAAFERLTQLKLYPSPQVKLGSEAEETLRALADYEAGNGNVPRAIEIYQKLLDQIQATKPTPETSLADALARPSQLSRCSDEIRGDRSSKPFAVS